MRPRFGRVARLAWLAVAGVLGGCASFSPDGGFGLVEQTARDRLGKQVLQVRSEADLGFVEQRVAELLAKPLTAATKSSWNSAFTSTWRGCWRCRSLGRLSNAASKRPSAAWR